MGSRASALRALALAGLVALAAVVIVMPAAAADGGNSAAAKACQKEGYKSLFRADGTAFNNTGECVSYAAQGGQFVTRKTATLSNVQFSACNELTLGYSLDGVEHDLETKPYGCTTVAGSDQTITYLSNQTLKLFLRDETCDVTFYEDGPHGTVVGTNPYEVSISDAGFFCESGANDPRPGANVIATVTIS